MSATDELLENARRDAAGFDKGDLPLPPSKADTGIKPEWAAEAFPDLDADVRQSIGRITASPFIPDKSSVRGFVYDVKTGELNEVT